MARRDYRDFDDREELNAIQRDRLERRRSIRRKSMITNITIGIVALAVVAGIIVAVVAMTGNSKKDDQEPTTVTATIASETQKPQETKTQATQGSQQSQNATQPAVIQYETQSQWQPETTADSYQQEATAAPGGTSGGGSSTLHYYAFGKTSYGYDWTYSGGGGVVSVACDYSFDNNRYDFVLTGVSEGTATITLYYNTDDGVQVPVPMTVYVDSNLNVTQIG